MTREEIAATKAAALEIMQREFQRNIPEANVREVMNSYFAEMDRTLGRRPQPEPAVDAQEQQRFEKFISDTKKRGEAQ